MKNALLLHGTAGSSQSNWIPWLSSQLKEKGWEVWSPDLPHSERPNLTRYNKFLLANKDWQFNAETVLVGHSSGAVAILGLLQALPDDVVIDKAILVSGFLDDLGWDSLTELFEKPFDFAKIKKKAKQFIIIHSDNDPYVPIENATMLAEKLDGQLIIKEGQGHFNLEVGAKYKEFPLLLQLIR